MTDPRDTRKPRPTRLVASGVAVVVGGVLAFRYLDPVIAAFLVIFAATILLMAVVARDWDRHPDYEEREAARARKRAAKWERGTAARDRDRARWEAHQARQAGKAQQADRP